MSEEDLFDHEKRVIEDAETLLKSGSFGDRQSAGWYKNLLGQYKKLYKQIGRLIRAGDRMQNDLNQLNTRLRLSEEKYRNIFENATEGIFQSRLNGSFFKVNPAMARMFRFDTPAQMVGSENLNGRGPFVCPEERDDLLRSVIEQGRVSSYQVEMRRWDGEHFWVEISARSIKDNQGRITHIEGLLSDITLRKRLHEELKELATTDSLTGLYNRRSFIEILNEEFNRARHRRLPLSLLMIDADHFKSVNDTYGHDMGDRVLKRLAQICRQILREGDSIGRLGGEEFAVVLPNIELCQACQVAERLRKTVADTIFSPKHSALKITVSIGVSTVREEVPNGEFLLTCADRALYDAKRKSRNAVCIQSV